MTATLKTSSNGQTRKTLASQLDRLDGILDGLDAALSGAVQEAIGLAVKEAVQAVLSEVLTNHNLQEQLLRASTKAMDEDDTRNRNSLSQRLWNAAAQGVQRTVQSVKKAGRGMGLAVLAASGVVAGVAYAARRRLVSLAATVYQGGKRLLGGAVTALIRVLPKFAFSVI
ncbi:MAG TPA: hypothetical protein VH682_23305 [Gemmataceae bacterium]|jgi:hypothetical protein